MLNRIRGILSSTLQLRSITFEVFLHGLQELFDGRIRIVSDWFGSFEAKPIQLLVKHHNIRADLELTIKDP